jgi:hypothetical protein
MTAVVWSEEEAHRGRERECWARPVYTPSRTSNKQHQATTKTQRISAQGDAQLCETRKNCYRKYTR